MAKPKESAGFYGFPRDCWTGEACPQCGIEIVYSGNYFCASNGNLCDWAMPDDGDTPLFKRCYRGLMRNRERHG